MDGQDIRNICRASDSVHIRIEMLNFFFNPIRSSTQRLIQLINSINEYVVMKHSSMCGEVVEKRQESTNVVQKLEFNISLSKTKLK